MKKYKIYTDGSSNNMNRTGGWACAVLDESGKKNLYCGSEQDTTNNRMEMMAAVAGLGIIELNSEVEIFTDSQYLKNGITTWIQKWKVNGWRTSDKKDVLNKDLWLILDDLASKNSVNWNWVKGHSGDPLNEEVDALCYRIRVNPTAKSREELDAVSDDRSFKKSQFFKSFKK